MRITLVLWNAPLGGGCHFRRDDDEDETLMNLMNMVRLFGLVLIGWTFLALGVGLCRSNLRPARETHFFLPQPSLHEAVGVSRSQLACVEEYRLVDRSTGKAQPLPLPRDAAWGFVTVSPWRDQDGNLEAVGRWSRPGVLDDQSFYGLGLFRVSDATIVRSIDLDVLPTGRPCWVPGRPGDLVFPAGDGQLYRCRLTHDGNMKANAQTSVDDENHPGSSRSVAPGAVTWRCAVPGSGRVFIADPVWPADKPLGPFVFVSLTPQTNAGGRPRNEPSQIWWLEMSEFGDEILSAGRFTVPAPASAQGRPLVERLPSVSVSPSGRLTLAYLTRARASHCGDYASPRFRLTRQPANPWLPRWLHRQTSCRAAYSPWRQPSQPTASPSSPRPRTAGSRRVPSPQPLPVASRRRSIESLDQRLPFGPLLRDHSVA